MKLEQGQTKKGFKFGLGFVAAAALVGWLLKRGSAVQGIRSGGGVTIRGGITGINAGMGADLVKQPGGRLTAQVGWGAATTNPAGELIPWPYNLRATLKGGATDYANACLDSLNCRNVTRPAGGYSDSLPMNIPTNIPPGVYTVVATLWAAISDDQGNPTDRIVVIATVEAPDKVIIPASAQPVQPAGDITGVTLSQVIRRRP